jgi:CRP/FNR family cyclic AMP-dependent transcriptional regulator
MAAAAMMAWDPARKGRATATSSQRNGERGLPLAGAGIRGRETTRAALFSRVALFAGLSEEGRHTLAEACRSRTFEPGEVLFHEGEAAHALYIVRSGQVKIVLVAADGGETILQVYGTAQCLGEMALLEGGERCATAVAMGPVEVLVLYRDDFLALVKRQPEVALALVGRLVGMVRQLNLQVQDLVRLDIKGRLARKLLELADQHGETTAEGLCIALRLTQQELAQMVGAARSNVNKYLGWFQERRILTVEREQIVIHKPQELRKWSRRGR